MSGTKIKHIWFQLLRNPISSKIFAYSSISFLNGLLNFIFISFAARLISKSDMGIIGLFLATTYFIIPAISFGTSNLVGINIVNYSNRKFIHFFNSVTTFSIYSLLPVSILVIVLTIYFEMTFFFFLLLILFSIIRNFISLSDIMLIQKKKVKKYGIEKIRTSVLVLGIGLVMLNFISLSWHYYIIAFILAESLSVFFRYKKCYHFFRFGLTKNTFKELLIYGLPLIVGIFGSWLLNQSDKIIVEQYFGLEILGGYALAFQIGVIIRTFNQSIINAIIPYLYESYKVGNFISSQKKYFLMFFLIGILLICGVYIFTEYFFDLIYGKKYSDFKVVVILVSIAFFFEGLYKVWDTSLVYLKKNSIKTIILFISGGIGISTSILLIPKLDIVAPAIGTVFAYFILMTVTLVYSIIISKRKYEYSN